MSGANPISVKTPNVPLPFPKRYRQYRDSRRRLIKSSAPSLSKSAIALAGAPGRLDPPGKLEVLKCPVAAAKQN